MHAQMIGSGRDCSVMGPSIVARAAIALALGAALIGCQPAGESGGENAARPARPTSTQPTSARPGPSTGVPSPPPAFEPMPVPPENPLTVAKMNLGKKLFFDNRLSGDGSRSCYSCHVCEKGTTDGLPTAVGAFGKQLPRSSPALWNIGYHKEFYWDGRSTSLEKQAIGAWTGGNMGADANAVAASLDAIGGYHDEFMSVFGTGVTPDAVAAALASFERTIYCGTTAWDRFNQGETDALSPAAQRGWNVWREKSGCGTCHAGILFTDLQFHNVGIGMDKKEPDQGRKVASKDDKDTGAFKTPTLRDISKSAPYFHDGSTATLEEAVDIMLGGGKPNPWLDSKNLKPVKLSAEDRSDLIELLRSLSCECDPTPPPLPGL